MCTRQPSVLNPQTFMCHSQTNTAIRNFFALKIAGMFFDLFCTWVTTRQYRTEATVPFDHHGLAPDQLFSELLRHQLLPALLHACLAAVVPAAVVGRSASCGHATTPITRLVHGNEPWWQGS